LLGEKELEKLKKVSEKHIAKNVLIARASARQQGLEFSDLLDILVDKALKNTLVAPESWE